MRIITGDYKGRKLETPRNNDIRPTPEKAKEAIFSMLMDRLDGAICCDLFAGTGASRTLKKYTYRSPSQRSALQISSNTKSTSTPLNKNSKFAACAVTPSHLRQRRRHYYSELKNRRRVSRTR